LTITDRGDLTVDYNGMQPLEIRLAGGSTGTGTLQGVGRAVITARSGTMTPSSYDGSGVPRFSSRASWLAGWRAPV
jgi:hypothetical protein